MKSLNNNKEYQKALDLFEQHRKTNIGTLSSLTITQALKACTQLKDLKRGCAIHRLISSCFKDDNYILTSLIHFYMQCGDMKRAQSLFDAAPRKSLSIYGAMMKGYIKNKRAEKAIDLFHQIINPDEAILVFLFNACTQLETSDALDLAKKTYQKMPKSFHENPYLTTSLVDVFKKCGDMSGAQSVRKELSVDEAMMKGYLENNQAQKAVDLFNQIKNPSEINLIVLFNACAQLGTIDALNLVKKVSKEMPKSYHSNSRLLVSLFDALIKCGDCSSAELLFPKLQPAMENYGNLMNGFNKENNLAKTLNLYDEMKKKGINGNVMIYLSVLKVLSQRGDYRRCQSIVKEIPLILLSNNQIQTALIDMWSNLGHINRAREIFSNISQPDQVEYNTMINAYGLNGMGKQAIELYRRMPAELIDEITHVGVLNACSQSGLVDEARSIFRNIPDKTGSIYCKMVDCLSRASLSEEAQELINDYEHTRAPVLAMHMALLSGSRNANNSSSSKQVYDRMKKLFPQMPDSLAEAAVLVANVSGSSEEHDKASQLRIQLHETRGKRKIGVSWTAPNGQIATFRAHDRSHPRSTEIHGESKKISKELIEHGHQYDASWITRPLAQDETIESVLSGHSERLAIAWNFLVNPNASQIQIANNLRMCGDCHAATKLIAAIRKCEIMVRDANRIHHFGTNGQCSCNDHF